MNQKFFIGVDCGTQSSKVSIFDKRGNVVASSVQKLRALNMPKAGVAEHPDDDVWHAISIACRRAMDAFPYNPHTIVGLGLCTIRCCLAELNQRGELVSPMLSWMDERVAKTYDWSANSKRKKENQVQYVTTSSGYISHRLTGEFKDTSANYEGQWPLDKLSWQWSRDASFLNKFCLHPENLFELVMPGEVLGKVTKTAANKTGLPEGLPVIATANDKAVEALGAGLRADGDLLISLGTYIGGMVQGKHYVADAQSYFSNLACRPNHYLYESGGVRNGMGTISWLCNLLGKGIVNEAQQAGISIEQMLNQEARSIAAGSDGLITIPEWLAPYHKPYKRGALLGLTARHTRAHIYKSIIEAIALTMKNHVDAMQAETGINITSLSISGGGARSDIFMQVFADVFALTTRRNKIVDSAGLGAAMCAAIASNEIDSFDKAIQNMVRPDTRFEHNATNTEFYQRLNTRIFKDITLQTDPLFERVHAMH